jgi:hypothetical protein
MSDKRRVLAAALMLAMCSGCSGPWGLLEDRYAATGPDPSGSEVASRIALRATSVRGMHRYRGRVVNHFGDHGVYLALGGIVGLTTSPLSIPASAVTACSRTRWQDRTDAMLWIEDVGVEITLADHDGRVIGWCKARGINIVEPARIEEWMAQRRAR